MEEKRMMELADRLAQLRELKSATQAGLRDIEAQIDEVEAHLHPSWQRSIIPALLSVLRAFADSADIQIIVSTHSPLVMASAEPTFDTEKDAWFDLDLVDKAVVLTRREFVKHGDAKNWLTSEAFDLKSTRAIKYEQLLEEASSLINQSSPSPNEITRMHNKLLNALGPKDDFLFRWRAICEKKGWGR